MPSVLYADNSKSDFLPASADNRNTKGMNVIQTYFDNVVLATCVNFFKGCLTPRGEASFNTITPENVKNRIIDPPFFSDVMAEYVLTEILPLKKIYKAEHMLDTVIAQQCNNDKLISSIQEQFTKSIVYAKEFADVWPKDHPCAYERLDKKGNKKTSIYMMSKQAAQKLCKAKLLLIEYLKLTKVNMEDTEEVTESILQFSSVNTLNISGQGLSSMKEKLVNGFMWICTAFTDWLQIEAVYPADVLASIRMMLPFEEDDDSNVILDASIPLKASSVTSESEKKYILELEERIYSIYIKQDLYPSDEALALTIGFLEYMSKHKDIAEKTLHYIEYLTR